MDASKEKREDSNCDPRSVVTVDGTPKFAIQYVTKAEVMDSAVISESGIEVGQRVKWSIMVRRY